MISIALVGLVGLGGFGVLGTGFSRAIGRDADSGMPRTAPMATSQQAALIPSGAVDALATTGKFVDDAKVVSAGGDVAAALAPAPKLGEATEAFVKRVRGTRLEDIGGDARGELRFGIKLEGEDAQRISVELNDISDATKVGDLGTRGLRSWSLQMTRSSDGFSVDYSTLSARVDEVLRNAANEFMGYFDSTRGNGVPLVNIAGGRQGSPSVVESFRDDIGRLSSYKPIAFADWITELNESRTAQAVDEEWRASARAGLPAVDQVLKEVGRFGQRLEEGGLVAMFKGDMLRGFRSLQPERVKVSFEPGEPRSLSVSFVGKPVQRDKSFQSPTIRLVRKRYGDSYNGEILRVDGVSVWGTTTPEAFAGDVSDFEGLEKAVASLRFGRDAGVSEVTLEFIADGNGGFRIEGGELKTSSGTFETFQRGVLPGF